MNKIDELLVGKKVIVRANVAGVHAGEVVSSDTASNTVMLKNARRLWRYYTQDPSGSVSDVAANGLKKGADHSIGAVIPTVTISNGNNGLELAEMTDAAHQSVMTYAGK